MAFQKWKHPAYRVAQLLEWLYTHRVTDWEAMSNLPKTLRDQLRQTFSLHALELVTKQGAPVLRSPSSEARRKVDSTAEGGRLPYVPSSESPQWKFRAS